MITQRHPSSDNRLYQPFQGNQAPAILIIDDNVEVGTGLERFFRLEGLEAISKVNGVEALSVLYFQTPRLILLDLDMPVVDGMTILRTLRGDSSFKSVPIVIYTSAISIATRKAAIDAGAQDYFIKGTIGWDVLAKRVHELLGGSRSESFEGKAEFAQPFVESGWMI